jgi:hypothetical protein
MANSKEQIGDGKSLMASLISGLSSFHLPSTIRSEFPTPISGFAICYRVSAISSDL